MLIPLRALPNAKSRLAVAVPADRFAAVVTAIRADTVAAPRGASPVAPLVIARSP